MERETLRPRGNPSSRWSLPASSRRRTCSGWLERYCFDRVTNLVRASRSTMRSSSGLRFGWVWIGLVRGLSLGLRFFFSFFGVLVTRKEVENGAVRVNRRGSRLGFLMTVRALEKKKQRQAMESL